MDGGPFSAVIAERQEVGHHIVTPEMTQYVGNKFSLEVEKQQFVFVGCV